LVKCRINFPSNFTFRVSGFGEKIPAMSRGKRARAVISRFYLGICPASGERHKSGQAGREKRDLCKISMIQNRHKSLHCGTLFKPQI